MFNLSDGRKSLYQWDLNRQVTVYDETITEVHFANERSTDALVTEVRNGKADIPNILLQENVKNLYVYGVDINFTKYFEKFPIIARAKPSDYAYTETDVKALDDVIEKVNYLVDIVERITQLEENDSMVEEELASIKVFAEDAATYSQSAHSSLNGINTTVNNIDTSLSNLNTKVNTATTGISNNNTLITENKNSLESLNTKVDNLNNNMTANSTAVNEVNTNVANQAASLTEIQSSVEEVKNLILALGNGEENEGIYLEVPDYAFDLTGNINSKFQLNRDIWLVEQVPDLFYGQPTDTTKLFYQSNNLKTVPSLKNVDFSRANNDLKEIFSGCYDLVEISEDFLKSIPMNERNVHSGFYNTFNCCYLLKSIKGLTFSRGYTNNRTDMFSDAFKNTYQLENLEFACDDNNQPRTVNFSGNVINLCNYVGFAPSTAETRFRNRNIPVVTNRSEYESLKDSEYGALDYAYSHYNHDSAVRTINSLPDSSNCGTNAIWFKGISGSGTDGGAINTLTDEEIAVATEKGWTVVIN